jgi:hypothetical protein
VQQVAVARTRRVSERRLDLRQRSLAEGVILGHGKQAA